jgi:hypothetical protein
MPSRAQCDATLNERDLLGHAEAAGFVELHVELVIDVEPGTCPSYLAKVGVAGSNPVVR